MEYSSPVQSSEEDFKTFATKVFLFLREKMEKNEREFEAFKQWTLANPTNKEMMARLNEQSKNNKDAFAKLEMLTKREILKGSANTDDRIKGLKTSVNRKLDSLIRYNDTLEERKRA
ncbi:hypothetical protein, partial [Serratia marcescens]|uniref:hypothetical protein n=1 Tax=Serratia marcescens TaxID=615 RepID=UPI0028136BEF